MLWITNNFHKNEWALINSLPSTLWSGSRSVMSDSLWCHGLYSSWNSPCQNSGVSSLSHLQGLIPTQGLNQVSCIAGGFFTSWAPREAQEYWSGQPIASPGNFPTQELNWGLLHCRWVLYHWATWEAHEKGTRALKHPSCLTCRRPGLRLPFWTESICLTSSSPPLMGVH